MNVTVKPLVIITFSLILSACCSNPKTSTSTSRHSTTISTAVSSSGTLYSATNPEVIRFYEKQALSHQPYQVIGHITVNRYNEAGEKRPLGVMSDVLKQNAAKLGGEGLANIHTTPLEEFADVIRFSGKMDETYMSPSYMF